MKKARLVLAAAAAAALTLTGCAHSASTAVSVNGVNVTDSEIERAAAALGAAQQADPSQYTSKVIAYETLGLIAQKVAADQNIELSDAARLAALDSTTAQLRDNADLKPLVDRTADGSIVYTKLGYDKWVEACQQVPVTLNPRYGSWSSALCSIVPGGSLAQAAPTANA